MRIAIIVAGGEGERFGRPGGKQLASVAGVPLVTHSLRAFDGAPSIDAVVLVCDPDRVEEYRVKAVSEPGITKVIAAVAGGSTRRASVVAGLAAVPANTDVVAVHDGARPLVEADLIDRAVAALDSSPGVDGVVVGHPSSDTIKTVDAVGNVTGTPDRSTLWLAQTPQVFHTDSLLRAHDRAEAEGWQVTDDASVVERAGGTVRMIPGPRWNMKVTFAEDLAVVEAILAERGRR